MLSLLLLGSMGFAGDKLDEAGAKIIASAAGYESSWQEFQGRTLPEAQQLLGNDVFSHVRDTLSPENYRKLFNADKPEGSTAEGGLPPIYQQIENREAPALPAPAQLSPLVPAAPSGDAGALAAAEETQRLAAAALATAGFNATQQSAIDALKNAYDAKIAALESKITSGAGGAVDLSPIKTQMSNLTTALGGFTIKEELEEDVEALGFAKKAEIEQQIKGAGYEKTVELEAKFAKKGEAGGVLSARLATIKNELLEAIKNSPDLTSDAVKKAIKKAKNDSSAGQTLAADILSQILYAEYAAIGAKNADGTAKDPDYNDAVENTVRANITAKMKALDISTLTKQAEYLDARAAAKPGIHTAKADFVRDSGTLVSELNALKVEGTRLTDTVKAGLITERATAAAVVDPNAGVDEDTRKAKDEQVSRKAAAQVILNEPAIVVGKAKDLKSAEDPSGTVAQAAQKQALAVQTKNKEEAQKVMDEVDLPGLADDTDYKKAQARIKAIDDTDMPKVEADILKNKQDQEAKQKEIDDLPGAQEIKNLRKAYKELA